MSWEAVIGLEIHVQLATKSKLFSGSSTAFGAAPNTQASLVDLGMPGTLPVFNGEALKMAAQFGLAINAQINQRCVFDRKNYFYPDLPKGYQITQLHQPIVAQGHINISLEDGTVRTITITRAHLEEDAGKSLHEDFHGYTGIDLNRAGTPLLEIVSEPDLRSAKEAAAYFRKIHSIVTYLGICDGDLSQGSMRCDCNVSLRPKGDTKLGTRTELKNINSFRFVEKAIETEIERQINLLESGEHITQETRLYDSERNQTRSMRSKEVANDYRYFPDPDLLPVTLTEADIQQLKAQLPELPDQKIQRFTSHYQLSLYNANLLCQNRATADYFEAATAVSQDAKITANWITGELTAALNRQELSIDDSPINAQQLGQLIMRIKDNTLSSKTAKQVFQALFQQTGAEVDAIIQTQGLKQVTDTSAISAIIDRVLQTASKEVAQYQSAPEDKRKKMLGFFVGQAMKASKGKANPQQLNALLIAKLTELSSDESL